MEVPQTLPVGIESYETDPAYNKSRVLAYRRWLASPDKGINPDIFIWIPGAAEMYAEALEGGSPHLLGPIVPFGPGSLQLQLRTPPATTQPAYLMIEKDVSDAILASLQPDDRVALLVMAYGRRAWEIVCAPIPEGVWVSSNMAYKAPQLQTLAAHYRQDLEALLRR